MYIWLRDTLHLAASYATFCQLAVDLDGLASGLSRGAQTTARPDRLYTGQPADSRASPGQMYSCRYGCRSCHTAKHLAEPRSKGQPRGAQAGLSRTQRARAVGEHSIHVTLVHPAYTYSGHGLVKRERRACDRTGRALAGGLQVPVPSSKNPQQRQRQSFCRRKTRRDGVALLAKCRPARWSPLLEIRGPRARQCRLTHHDMNSYTASVSAFCSCVK
jgi:hypothetical protein